MKISLFFDIDKSQNLQPLHPFSAIIAACLSDERLGSAPWTFEFSAASRRGRDVVKEDYKLSRKLSTTIRKRQHIVSKFQSFSSVFLNLDRAVEDWRLSRFCFLSLPFQFLFSAISVSVQHRFVRWHPLLYYIVYYILNSYRITS